METKTKTKYEDEIFNIPFDMVKLPSEGKLYPSIGDVIGVEYMVTEDEEILFSNNLMDNGIVFNRLVEAKLKDKSVNVGDLLIGDFNKILVFLRTTAYGSMYKTKSLDPDTSTLIDQQVDLSKLSVQGLGADFDENGEFEYVLPLFNKRVTFKLLTVGLGDYINATAEKKVTKDGVPPYLTTKLETLIMSVEGDRDKLYISKFVKVMPPADRLALFQYIESIEPKVDLNYTFKSSIKKEEYKDKIVLGLDFFYPLNAY